MSRIKVSQNFYLDELIDPYTYFTDEDYGLSKLDPSIIDVAQLMRSLLNKPLVVNNWWGKHLDKEEAERVKAIEKDNSIRKWSGFRPAHCPIGASKSAHKYGQAIDLKGNELEMLKIIEDNARLFYRIGLRRLENPKITKGWFHIDTNLVNHRDGLIRVINLKDYAYDIPA